MADTTPLEQVEPYIHTYLRKKFNTAFSRKRVPSAKGEGFYEFGAVSEDGRVIASIRRSSGKTTGKNNPVGKIHIIFKDIQSLSQVNAEIKLIVITDPEFFAIVKNKTRGKLPNEIQLLHIPLPAELASLVHAVRHQASEEMDRGKNL